MTRLLPYLHAAAAVSVLAALGAVAAGVTAFGVLRGRCSCGGCS